MDFLDTYRVHTMHITQEMRQQACEGLLHFTPKKELAVSWVFPLVRSETGLFISSTVSSIGSTILGAHAGLSCSKAPSTTGSSITPLATAMLLSSLA